MLANHGVVEQTRLFRKLKETAGDVMEKTFQPTRATALVYENGTILASNGGNWELDRKRVNVPCLILPAEVPIAAYKEATRG